jgi:Leucine-rich repeat (LRR) protein
VGKFAEEYGIGLEELEIRSRSLLNRNAEGKYKFAHKSILEYLLSLELLRDSHFCQTFKFDNLELTQRFYQQQFYHLVFIPFFSRIKNGHFGFLDDSSSIIKYEYIGELNLKVLEIEKIVELDLRRNQITDITPLKELNRLENIDLTGNPIKDKNTLAGLKKRNVRITFF